MYTHPPCTSGMVMKRNAPIRVLLLASNASPEISERLGVHVRRVTHILPSGFESTEGWRFPLWCVFVSILRVGRAFVWLVAVWIWFLFGMSWCRKFVIRFERFHWRSTPVTPGLCFSFSFSSYFPFFSYSGVVVRRESWGIAIDVPWRSLSVMLTDENLFNNGIVPRCEEGLQVRHSYIKSKSVTG